MKFISIFGPFLSLATLASAIPGGHHDPEVVAAKQVNALHAKYVKTVEGILKQRKTGCTPKNVRRRKEWNTLTKHQRLDYINSVHCLANLTPPKIPTSQIPGVRTRYDDFVGAHAIRTLFIHQDGLFLAYHRHFLHLYEKALREECGFKGALPYWDWSISWKDVNKSPLFDGSPYSLGSNGVFIPSRNDTEVINVIGNLVVIPPGTGGGCVYSGPFSADMYQVHMGPFTDPVGPDDGFGYNPRCLVRDLNKVFSQYSRPSAVLDLVGGCGDLTCFSESIMTPGSGLHSAGHIQMGGIEIDVFASPSDPVFWLHHGMVDRVWAIWQHLGPGRTQEVWGTGTVYNIPPSPNVTLDTPLDFGGVISPTGPLRDFVTSIDGDHCYIYE